MGWTLLLAAQAAAGATLAQYLFDQGANSYSVINSVAGGEQPLMQDFTSGSAGVYYNLHALGGKFAGSAGMMSIPYDASKRYAAKASITVSNWTSRSAVTLEAWVNPSVVLASGTNQDVINYNGVLLRLTQSSGGGNGLVGGVYHAPTPGWTTTPVSTITGIPTGSWTHLALTYDGANIRTYVNGILQQTTACTGNLATNNSGAVAVGAFSALPNQSFSNPFYGGIDEIRLSDAALPSGAGSGVNELAWNASLAPISTPTFSPDGGPYVNAQTVTITCATPGATIYYTTDGSTPTTGSQNFASGGTVAISSSLTLKAFAMVAGQVPSVVKTAVYTILSGSSVYFYEILDNTPLGALDNTTATYNGGSWDVAVPASCALNVINDPTGGSHGHVIEYSDNNSLGYLELYAKLSAARNEPMVYSYDIYLPSDCGPIGAVIRGSAGTEIIRQLWNTNGSISNYTNGSTVTAIDPATFARNTWYHATFTVYPLNHAASDTATYDFSLTRESDGVAIFSETGLLGRYAVGTTESYLEFGFKPSSGSDAGHFYVDNVQVAAVSAPAGTFCNFEPTTYARAASLNGLDGWIASATLAKVTPDTGSGYTGVLQGCQSAVLAGGTAKRAFATPPTLTDGTFIYWKVKMAAGGAFGGYLSDSIAAGSTPGGIELNGGHIWACANRNGDPNPSTNSQDTGIDYTNGVTYLVGMKLDFTHNAFWIFVQDRDNHTDRTWAGPYNFLTTINAATVANYGGFYFSTLGTSVGAIFDDIRVGTDPWFGSPMVNVALGKSYTWNRAPNYSLCTDSGDSVQLTDGVYTTSTSGYHTSLSTVGWQDDGVLDLKLDLGQIQPIGGVTFRTTGGYAGIAHPAFIDLWVSDDGSTFYYAGELLAKSWFNGLPDAPNATYPRGTPYGVWQYAAEDLCIKGRYLRLGIFQAETFVFCDEIEVFKGNFNTLETRPLSTAPSISSTTNLDLYTRTQSSPHKYEQIARLRMLYDLQELQKDPLAGQKTYSEQINQRRQDVLRMAFSSSDTLDMTKGLPYWKTGQPGRLAEHANLWQIHGQMAQAAGYPAFALAAADPYEPLHPFDRFAANATGNLHMIENERRPCAINVMNFTNTAVAAATVQIASSPAIPSANLDLRVVRYTEKQQRVIDSIALPKATSLGGTPPAWSVELPAGATTQLWLNVNSKGLTTNSVYTLTITLQGTPASSTPTYTLYVTVHQAHMPNPPSVDSFGWDYSYPGQYPFITSTNLLANMTVLKDYDVASNWIGGSYFFPSSSPGSFTDSSHATWSTLPTFTNFSSWLTNLNNASVTANCAQKRYYVFLDLPSNESKYAYGSARNTTGYNNAVKNFFIQVGNQIVSKGLSKSQFYFCCIDEPAITGSWDGVAETFTGLVKQAVPEFKFFIDPSWTYGDGFTSPGSPGYSKLSAVDLIIMYAPSVINDITTLNAYKSFGKDLGMYHCNYTGSPSAYYRQLAWRDQERGLTAFGFWTPDYRLNAWDAFYTVENYQVVFGSSTSATMDPSKLLAAWRDGVQDYEYFQILRNLITQANARGISTTAAQSAINNALANTDACVSDTDYRWKRNTAGSPTLENTAYDTNRVSLLTQIDALTNALGANAYNLTGTVNLGDFAGDVTKVALTVQLRQGLNVVRADNVTLTAGCQFTLTGVTAGTYDVRVKASHWLARTQTNVAVTANTTMASAFVLVNGDADGNNAIDASDLSTVLSALAAPNSTVDMDGDGEVTSTDLSIVLAGIDQAGNP